MMNGPVLIPVTWGGTELNPGDRADGVCLIVTEVEGWYGTPELAGNSLTRVLTDGAIYGSKIIGPRTVTVTGYATGPRDLLLPLSRELAALASAREPAELVIGEDGAALTAQVRADAEQMTHAWQGPVVFTYTVPLLAADPRLYEQGWREAVLTLGEAAGTGRSYPRAYTVQGDRQPPYPVAAAPATAGSTIALPLTGPVPEGSALVLSAGWGTTSESLTGVSDNAGSAWQVIANYQQVRACSLAIGRAARDMGPGDVITAQQAGVVAGRYHVLAVPPLAPGMGYAVAGQGEASATSISPALTLPAVPGRESVRVLGMVQAGTGTVEQASWPLGGDAGTGPAVRQFWTLTQPGQPAPFTATLSVSAMWSMTAVTLTDAGAGRRTWRYGADALPNSAPLANAGTARAPVWITYTGPLSETRLTDGTRAIRVAPLTDGQQLGVASETLQAVAPGGASRAALLLAGSQPMTLPARAETTWRLYGTGAGSVTLRWRGAYA